MSDTTSTPDPARARRTLVAVLTSLLVGSAIALAPPAAAQTFTRSGTIGADSPSMGVVGINGTADTCLTQSGLAVHYAAVPFRARAAGHYTITATSTPDDVEAVYVYQGSFDPLDGTTNCIAADNSADDGVATLIELDVAAPGKYVIVVIDDTFAQAGLDYQLLIDTPDGVATSPNRGSGSRYAKLGASYTCTVPRTASVRWTIPSSKVDKAVFKAGTKVVRTVNRVVPGRTLGLTDLPRTTTKLTGILTLHNGDRVKVVRTYYTC